MTANPARCEQEYEFRVTRFIDDDAGELIAEADAFNTELYGHADETPLNAAEFDPDQGGLFLVVLANGEPVACGGYRRHVDDATGRTAEMKRIYVRPRTRRLGVGRRLLNELESRARAYGYKYAILDVGSRQEPAHALYESCGYTRVPGFSIYRDSPGNRAYGKSL